jgi:hypothetical protein
MNATTTSESLRCRTQDLCPSTALLAAFFEAGSSGHGVENNDPITLINNK